MMMRQFFLASSFSPFHAPDLIGYAFVGRDLIIGRGGYDKFRHEGRGPIASGHDGAYIVVNRSDSETLIGADGSGFQKLFCYSKGDDWAISNSLLGLAEFLKEKGIGLTVNTPHLAAWFIVGPFANQLVSFQTCFNEIKFLPAHREIIVYKPTDVTSKDRLAIRDSDLVIRTLSETISYGDALAGFITTSTSRLATIAAAEPFSISCDLSGGKDSRIIFGMLMNALRTPGVDRKLSEIRFNSSIDQTEDYAAAERVASAYGITLNHGARRHVAHVSSQTLFNSWKYGCVGI